MIIIEIMGVLTAAAAVAAGVLWYAGRGVQ